MKKITFLLEYWILPLLGLSSNRRNLKMKYFDVLMIIIINYLSYNYNRYYYNYTIIILDLCSPSHHCHLDNMFMLPRNIQNSTWLDNRDLFCYGVVFFLRTVHFFNFIIYNTIEYKNKTSNIESSKYGTDFFGAKVCYLVLKT